MIFCAQTHSNSNFTFFWYCLLFMYFTEDWRLADCNKPCRIIHTYTHIYMCISVHIYIGFLVVKKLPVGLIRGSGRSPGGGHGNPLQYFCLENPMDRGAGGLQSLGPQRVGHDWAHHIHICVCLLSCKPLCIIAILGTVHTCSELIPSTMVWSGISLLWKRCSFH